MTHAVGEAAALSRRHVLRLGALTAGLWAAGGAGRAAAGAPARRVSVTDLETLSPFERRHVPVLRLPVVTTNGAKVPVTVELDHPMEPDHHISRIHLVNARDPVPSKGLFHLSPANGQAYLAFQVRIDEGVSEVSATAECSRHGRWSSVASVNVPAGGGGCVAPTPRSGRGAGPEILPPRLRIPQVVKHGRLRPDEVVDVQLSMRHPNRTGLARRNGTFVQESEPFHLRELEVLVGDEPVSRFALTSALSDDPLITFRLRVEREALLRAVLVNTRGQRFEASHPLRFR
jgi:sulfur-oxidizing protein SoxY